MRTLCASLALILMTPVLLAEISTEEIIAKARQFLGGDEALTKITSIHYEGVFTTANGDTGSIEIIFAKPLKQRVQVVTEGFGEVTALNDFDAWRKYYDPANQSRWSMELLDSRKIRELQANTWENLNFFSGIEQRRGTIENRGITEIEGRKVIQLVFKHPPEVRFTRFFDVETGRLVMTRTHEGSEIREEGEIRVEGVLFPEKITMSRDGEIVNEIRFQKVTLNKSFDDAVFNVPPPVP